MLMQMGDTAIGCDLLENQFCLVGFCRERDVQDVTVNAERRTIPCFPRLVLHTASTDYVTAKPNEK